MTQCPIPLGVTAVHGDAETRVGVRAGALDFLDKPLNDKDMLRWGA
jgi:FixJ family two-component response regulator